MNGWMILLQAPFFGEMWQLIWHSTLTVHYGYSLAVERAMVVNSLLAGGLGVIQKNRS